MRRRRHLRGASVHERVLRGMGKTALGGTVATPPLWIYSPILALAIVTLVVGAVALVAFGLWYLCWVIDGCGGGSYPAAYLGAGFTDPDKRDFYSTGNAYRMCPPYWVYGLRFRRRLLVRRTRELERACGLGPSAFTVDLSELR